MSLSLSIFGKPKVAAMKYVLLIVLFGLVVVSCQKRSPTGDIADDYLCYLVDSVVSNIPKLDTVHYTVENHSGQTRAQIDVLIKVETKTDTIFYRNDTLVQEYIKLNCGL